MNRPTQFSEAATTLESKEMTLSAPPTRLDFDGLEESVDISLQVEWDDFDTGTLDD